MMTRFGQGLIAKVVFCTAIILLLSSHTEMVRAQTSQPQSLRRSVIVGDLAGRTDLRNFRILTRQGLIPLTGTGNGKPFRVVRKTDEEATVRFYEYGLEPFNPHTVTIRLFESERALISALILEQVDFAVLASEASAIDIRKSNNHYLPLPIPMEQNSVKLIIYNHHNPLFSSGRIRTALTMAIDHGHIINKIILGGKATIARGPFDDDSPFYNSDLKSYKYNPRMALQILKNEGWLDTNRDGIVEKDGRPFVIELGYQKGLVLDEAISRSIKINLIKIGVDVHPRPLTRAQINDRLAARDFEAILTDWVFEDGVNSLRNFFSVDGHANYMSYKSSTMERYLRFHDDATDERRKRTLIESMQSVINHDQPVTFLYFKWLTHYVINVHRFADYRYLSGPNRGKIRPFEEWIVKPAHE